MIARDFRPAISRALRRECKSDLLGLIAPGQCQPVINRRAWLRLDSILSQLKRGEPLNRSLVKINERTLARDISFLRRRGHPISYDQKRYTYVLRPKTNAGDGHHS